MGDPPKPADKPKPGWVTPFAVRMCLIGWLTLVLVETVPFRSLQLLCILFGSHASAIAVLTCLIVVLRYRKGILVLLLIATLPPAAYFTIVLQKIAHERGWPV